MCWKLICCAAAGTLIVASGVYAQTISDHPPAFVDYAESNLPAWFRTEEMLAADNTPEDNPITDAGAELGRALFYDRRLSHNDTIACANCHQQKNGFTDPNQQSVGFQGDRTQRHSMSLANVRYYQRGNSFWDERAETVEEQVLMPIVDQVEMGSNFPDLINELSQVPQYAVLFRRAFGDTEITTDRIARSVAQFMRSMVSYQSPFDEAIAAGLAEGNPDPDFDSVPSITNPNVVSLGHAAFETNCAACHTTVAQIAVEPQNNGLQKVNFDPGADNGRFKVPSLRNVGVRRRFMHDGSFSRLRDVVEFYSDEIADNPDLSSHIPRGGFDLPSETQAAIVAFLMTLTDETFLTSELFTDPFQSTVDPLIGDASQDGSLSAVDIDVLCSAININQHSEEFDSLVFDVNGDGELDLADQRHLTGLLGTFLGDTNLDGSVDFSDFLNLAWTFGSDGGWTDGDTDCDGTVGFMDFLTIANNFGEHSASLAIQVPEPAHTLFPLPLALLLAQILQMGAKRSRRRS